MTSADPASSWWFYAPFTLIALAFVFLVVLAIAAPERKSSERESMLIGFLFLGLLAWALGNAARFLIYIIPSSGPVISNPYFAVPATAAGFFLYWMRGKFPFFYGMTEISVSVLAILVSIGTPNTIPLNKVVAILGGIYIFIRGMDNMDKGLPVSWRPMWDWIFPKRAASQLIEPTKQIGPQKPQPQ